jgi:hypothetical protein
VGGAKGDGLLYQYEGDVFPYDESAGWEIYNPCESPCSESLQNGQFVLSWPIAGDLAAYHYWIAEPPEQPPPSLWVEWRFRSNHPVPPHSYTCDAKFTVQYEEVHDLLNMYGDAVISFSGDDAVTGLDIDEFHTYRFESVDGVSYWFSVDGLVFTGGTGDEWNGYHFLQFAGRGGCIDDWIPDMMNEWDMVRFGTIAYGEQIIASDPPAGYLDPKQHADLDRFTVTFDSTNYVYLDEITVEVTGGIAPVVTQTRRREGDGSETVEIVLDRPLPMDERTRFTFNDGVAINVVEYTFIPPPIPTVSEWGMVIMALLVITTASVCFTRRRSLLPLRG